MYLWKELWGHDHVLECRRVPLCRVAVLCGPRPGAGTRGRNHRPAQKGGSDSMGGSCQSQSGPALAVPSRAVISPSGAGRPGQALERVLWAPGAASGHTALSFVSGTILRFCSQACQNRAGHGCP